MKIILPLVLLLFFFCSCGSDNNKQKKEDEQNVITQTGLLLDVSFPTSQGSSSYDIYVPEKYNPEQKWPLVIFLDPHAKGCDPVIMYTPLAEKYGFIIAGSNFIENNQQPAVQIGHVRSLINELKGKYSIYKMRICLAGFSGGARTAVSCAMNIPGISTVIGCGGGFPQVDKPITNRFDYIGMAGDEDFNFLEMKTLDKALDKYGIDKILITFRGKHEWPPLAVMDDAFRWTELKAMKKLFIPRNDAYADSTAKVFLSRTGNCTDNFEKLELCIEAGNFLEGLTSPVNFNSIADSLKEFPAVKNMITTAEEILLKEKSRQIELGEALNKQTFGWWKSEIKKLKNTSAGNDLNSMMNRRLLNYFSLLMFMNTEMAIDKNSVSAAGNGLELYELADPENCDVFYLKACWYAMQNDTAACIRELNVSVEKGFSDKKKLSADSRLQIIKNTGDYKKLLERL